MKVKITIFNALDNIAKRHNVTDESWAKSAKVRRPTISELRRMAIIANNNSDEKIGRACTLDKISSLFKGLYNILGGEMIKTDLTTKYPLQQAHKRPTINANHGAFTIKLMPRPQIFVQC